MVVDSFAAGLDVEDAKQALRSQVRAQRARRSQSARDELEKLWIPTVMDFIGDAEVITCYVSIKEEPPTRELCDTIVAAGKRLLLPKLGPGLSREWAWYHGADDLEVLAPGRPPEPSGISLGNEVLADVDALVIPALLVGRGGTRLGQGGGWYDRILKKVPERARVGAMVYPDEVVDAALPQDEMDRSVSYVILPDRWEATK